MDLERLRILPEHMREGMAQYLMNGLRPGTFLSLILEHDIYRAVAHADEFNQRAIYEYVYFLYNYVPVGAHGSKENVEKWIAAGGFNGLMNPKEVPKDEPAHDWDTAGRVSSIPARSDQGTEGITRDSMGNPTAYAESGAEPAK